MNVDRLNESERKFVFSARDLGFKVVRGGYPDFGLSSSKIAPFFVEVKDKSVISDNQDTMIQFLANAGIPSYVSRHGRFPQLDSPYYPVKIREPRCELCPINTTSERIRYEAEKHYRNKWSTKVHQLERKLERIESRHRHLQAASKQLLGQLEKFGATIELLSVGDGGLEEMVDVILGAKCPKCGTRPKEPVVYNHANDNTD